MLYYAWKSHLQEHVELFPVELAGRGQRRQAPLYQSFDEAVADLYELIRGRVDEMPYALFGHSMGNWLVYELSHRLSAGDHRKPTHLFLSGRRAPTIPHVGTMLHTLPESEFVDALVKLGGVSRELFENDDMRELFLSTIRADLKITETYEYVDRGRLVETPVTVLSGKGDPTITVRDLFAWRPLVGGPCSICTIDGGHFFITQNAAAVTKVVNQTLSQYVG